MTVMELIRNGGQMVVDMDKILEYVTSIASENQVLKTLVEKQGAIIVTVNDQIGVLNRKIDSLQDEVSYSKKTTDEIKHIKFVGQEMKVLPKAFDKIKGMSANAKQQLLVKAGRTSSNKDGKGFTDMYLQLEQLTGINVMDFGKIRLKKADGIDGWRPDPSYINVIFREGLEDKAAAIALQILADK